MRIITILTLITCLIACKKEVPEIPKAPETQRVQKVACIGDQIMLGAKTKKRKKSKKAKTTTYPIQLQQLLGEKYIVKTFAVNNATILKNGSTPYWEDSLFQKAQDFQPDIVVINLGMNDTKMHNWWKHGKEFTDDYLAMVKTFQTLKNKPRVILCRPLRPHDIIRGVNDSTMVVGVLPTIDSVATWQQLQTIDLYELLKMRDDLFNRTLHPDNTACRIIADKIADVIVGRTWKGY